jgi:serine/arginine repetitive matrix protein 2
MSIPSCRDVVEVGWCLPSSAWEARAKQYLRRAASLSSTSPTPTHQYPQQHSPFGRDVGEDGVKVTRFSLSWIPAPPCSTALFFWLYNNFHILQLRKQDSNHGSISARFTRIAFGSSFFSSPRVGGSMMLSDRDPNGGGRTSRASNMSALSRASGKARDATPSSDLLATGNNRAITSMLRTGTDYGLDDLAGVGNMHRQSQRVRASSRLSTASSMSNHSNRPHRQNRRHPSSSSAPRYSNAQHGPQYVADTLSPTMVDMPFSSPSMPPRVPHDRDPYRSQSMTNTIQPPYGLTSNRSFNSLRQFQSPGYPNPYGNGHRMHNPHRRPASPALSDNTGMPGRRSRGYDSYEQSYGGHAQVYANPGRLYHGQGQQYGGQGQQYVGYGNAHNVGQSKLRLPSSSSLGYQREPTDKTTLSPHHVFYEKVGDSISNHIPKTGSRMERLHSAHLPHLNPMKSLYNPPKDIPDFPPMPPRYKEHIAREQARLERSAGGSMSSGSTNMRTDSDPPSSDMASPPTPKDGTSMEVHHSRDGTVVIGQLGSRALVITEEYSAGPSYGPSYYDYSEDFYDDPGVQPFPCVNRIKTIIEERGPAEATPNSDSFLGQKAQPMSVEVVPSEISTIAELPASPVARRITRDLILKGLEPVSTTEDVGSSTKSPSQQGDHESSHSDDIPCGTRSATDELAEASLQPEQRNDNRHSILSQTGSSILDSSTLNFAVRHSIPVATGGGFKNDPVPNPRNNTNLPASPERSTEDGMSDVLAGYQRNDSKSGIDTISREELSSMKNKHLDEDTGTLTEKELRPLPLATRPKSNHIPKSSDEQSFKSCTDLPEADSEPPSPKPEKEQDGKSFRSATDDMLEREPSLKESDARSFATARATASPDRAASVAPSRLPSSNLGTMVMNQTKANSEVSLSKPAPAMLRKQPPVPRRESSFSIVASKLRTSSNPSVKHGSVSVSGSSSTLSTTHLPPPVPPRESSTSKEAQRMHAAVSFLMRPLPSRFAKGRKRTDQEDSPVSDEMDPSSSDSTQATPGSNAVMSSSPPVAETAKILDRMMLVKPPTGVPQPKMRTITFDTREDRTPQKALESSLTPVARQQPFNSPSPVVPEPSSVYSPQEDSSRFRSHSSPAGVPIAPEPDRRDSQTTTHLDWHRWVLPTSGGGPQPVPSRPSSGSGLPLNSLPPLTRIQEDTTTDLRLSEYRYPGPSRYLPDLKEESHEDSSLNTSASNLKNSSFRFPFGAPSVVRASGEDPISFSRRSSMQSHRRSAVGSGVGSALGQAHGLPSMRFSRMNLFDGLTEELGLRYSRSMEEVANVSQRMSKGSPPRPASAGDVTELRRISLAELEELERSRGSLQPTTVMSLFAMHRARSPEFVAEIERLTIPSVGGLTARFSEYFPSLREYYKFGEAPEFPAEEEIEKHALEEIHEIHPTQKRSSARLRPMRGSSHMIVIEDDLYEELTGRDKEKDSPGCQGHVGGVGTIGASEASSKATDIDESNEAISTPTHNKTTPLPELDTPSPVVLRPRSHTVGPQKLRSSGESSLSSRRSLRSFISTPTATETRPWNSDKNYPWATSTNPAIDISLPPPTAARQSPRAGPSHLRNKLSNASTASSFSTAQTATASPFGSAPDSNSHARQHRFSNFGRSGDQPHAVGERYPTSALSPPTAIFRDNLSDTSDDEHYDTTRKTRLSLRKRFSSTRKATLDSTHHSRVSRVKTNAQDLASPESTKQSTTSLLQPSADEAQAFTSTASNNRHTFRDAEGMHPAAYRKHRIIDRLKNWWHRGGNLIRNLSHRNKPSPSTNF